MLVASTTTNLAALGALSANGRSKTFEATADGYGRGEGCVVVAMRLANGDGQDCHAILQGGPLKLRGNSLSNFDMPTLLDFLYSHSYSDLIQLLLRYIYSRSHT